MTERELLLTVAAMVASAVLAWPAPGWAVALLVLVAVAGRHPVAVAVALVAAVGLLAARSERGIDVARPATVSGLATVVAAPERRPGGVVTEVRLHERRYRTFVPTQVATDLTGVGVGARVALTGRVGRLEGPWEWMASRHLAGRLRPSRLVVADAGSWWWRSAAWFHRRVADGLDSFDPAARALFLGIVVGDDREQSELDRHRFRASGLAHLLAVSGQNVAFVLAVAAPLLRRLPLRTRWLAVLVTLAWFALVTRLEPSVLRAVAMAGVGATASWWGRYASGVRVLAVAVVLLLLVDPLLVWSTGFRLSVAATAALILLGRRIEDRVPGPRWLAVGAAVGLAAQVGTAPLLVGMAGSLPLLGVVANVAAVPVAGWLMMWGLVAAPLAGLFGGPIATALGWPSRLMVEWIAGIAAVGAWPAWPRLGPVGVAGVVLGTLVAVAAGRRDRHPRQHAGRPVARSPAAATLVALALVVALGATAVDVAVLARRPAVVRDRGLTLWVAGGSAVLWVHGATERVALDALTTTRTRRVPLVVVTSGGPAGAQVVWTVRQAFPVDVVAAVHPGEVRDAIELRSGELVVDGRRFHAEAVGDDLRLVPAGVTDPTPR